MLRQFAATEFTAEAVLAAKQGRRLAVCLPARDEESTVGAVVAVVHERLVRDRPVVDELVVVDDGSTDRTAAVARAAGATVVSAASVLPEHPTGPGKGQAMWRAVHATTSDIVVFCDTDVRSFVPGYVLGLAGPLLARDDIQAVKGFYTRPLDGRPGEGGRVTELMARPLISMLFPHLGPLVQPLAGEFAARREVLEAVPFVDGYGVDIGLLIDIADRYGPEALAQCDLGERVHRNRSLTELGAQALAILQVSLQRSGAGSALPWTTVLQQPGPVGVPVTMTELPALRDLRSRDRAG